MKTLLNLIAFIVLTILVGTLSRGQMSLAAAIAAWWVIGMYIAMAYLRKERSGGQISRGSKAIFYGWYSLAGPILLVATKTEEYETTLLRYGRHY